MSFASPKILSLAHERRVPMLGLRKGAATVLPHDPQWGALIDKLLAEAHAWRKAVTA